MIMLAWCVIHVTDSQGTRHSQVDHQATGSPQLDEQVLRTPPAAGNPAALGLEYLLGHRPAKAGVSNDQLFDRAAGKDGFYAAQGGFDFWQLRQK